MKLSLHKLLTSIENPTLAHFRHFSSLLTDFPSTLVESALQIHLFMQNKAKFRKSQMNVNKVLTKDYEKKTLSERGKKQSQTNPNKANLLNAQMNVNKVLIKDYENKPNWTLGENEPKTNPIKANFKKDKMNVTSLYTVDYENKRLLRCGENKPNTNPTCRGVASGEAGSKPISKAKKC